MTRPLFTLLLLALLTTPLLAQEGPTNLTADLDEQTGEVTLNWHLPFVPEYVNEFDSNAVGWSYDNDANWAVENGDLVADFTGTADVAWTGAAYDEMYYEAIAETEFTKTAGSDNFSQTMFLRASGPYGDVTGFSGMMVSISPADFGGAFLITRYEDDYWTAITPTWVSFDEMNLGIGATNVVSVSVFDHQWNLFINGQHAYTWNDQFLSIGKVAIGFAEDIGVNARIETEYVAIDDLDIDPEPAPPIATVREGLDLPPTTDRYLIAQPETVRPRPMNRKVQPNGVIYANGAYQGDGQQDTGELDSITEFRVYRDGNLIGVGLDQHYVDQLPDYGQFDYMVTAFFDIGESDPSNVATVTWQDPANYPIGEDFDNGLPDVWWAEGSSATLNWHIDLGNERALFPSPYLLIDSDAPGSCPHVFGRIGTGQVDVVDPEALILQYDYVFDEYIDEVGEVAWSLDQETWNVIATYDEPDLSGTAVAIDIADQIAGEQSVWFSFSYDDYGNWGWYFAVDNVSVYLENGMGPYSFNLIPEGNDIPAGGGTLTYDAHLSTSLGQAFPNVAYWTEVVLPNGQTFGPLTMIPGLTIPPFADLAAMNLTQVVPAGAPAGSYTFLAYIGYAAVNVYDGFTFTKQGAATEAGEFEFDPAEWTASAVNFVAAGGPVEVTSLPSEFALAAAYPNPFNPSTTVGVTLPQAGDLTVAVYNVLGKQVAELASGRYDAGQHELVFDATRLASGLYFVHATVPGQLNATQKVMLVR